MMREMSEDFLARLGEAVEAGFLSPPQPAELPPGFPFRIATVAVDLPEGCRPPPGPVPRRIAVGRGEDAAEAAALALAEGVERYSLQYRAELPEAMTAFAGSSGGASIALLEEIVLGAPLSKRRVTSKGAAAGSSLEEAGARAILELIENHWVGRFREGKRSLVERFENVSPSSLNGLRGLQDWLEGQFRFLSLRLLKLEGACWVALALLHDFDKARPTEGAAAAFDPLAALRHAAWEAVFHWRNMVALEYHGASAAAMSERDRVAIMTYRGALTGPAWPPGKLPETAAGPVLSAGLEDLLELLARLERRPVLLFDLTHPAIGLPVVRAWIGEA